MKPWRRGAAVCLGCVSGQCAGAIVLCSIAEEREHMARACQSHRAHSTAHSVHEGARGAVVCLLVCLCGGKGKGHAHGTMRTTLRGLVCCQTSSLQDSGQWRTAWRRRRGGAGRGGAGRGLLIVGARSSVPHAPRYPSLPMIFENSTAVHMVRPACTCTNGVCDYTAVSRWCTQSCALLQHAHAHYILKYMCITCSVLQRE